MNQDENFKNRVYAILSGAKKIVYPPADERSSNTEEGNTLYLLNREERDKLIILEKEAEASLDTNLKKSALWAFVRFVNPHIAARLFSVKVESKHTQIDDQEKVFREIDTRLYFEEKRIVDAMNKALSKIEDDRSLVDEIKRDASMKIRAAQAHNIMLKKYRNSLKMRVSGLKKKRFYNELTCYLYPLGESEEAKKESLKRRSGHLSIDTPTALWYEAQEKKIHESDQKFIDEAIDAEYGDIYYVPLESSKLSKDQIRQEVLRLSQVSDEEFKELRDAYSQKNI
jgi:hypothetical protein